MSSVMNVRSHLLRLQLQEHGLKSQIGPSLAAIAKCLLQ